MRDVLLRRPGSPYPTATVADSMEQILERVLRYSPNTSLLTAAANSTKQILERVLRRRFGCPPLLLATVVDLWRRFFIHLLSRYLYQTCRSIQQGFHNRPDSCHKYTYEHEPATVPRVAGMMQYEILFPRRILSCGWLA